MLHRARRLKRFRNRLLFLAAVVLLLIFALSSNQMTDIERVETRGFINFLTIYGPTTYFVDGEGENGFDFLLAKSFADSVGVDLKVEIKPNLSSLLNAIGGPKGDMASANLIQSVLNEQQFTTSEPYLSTDQYLVYKRGKFKPSNLNEVKESAHFISNSVSEQTISKIRQNAPNIVLYETADLQISDLFKSIEEEKIDYAIVNSIEYSVNRHIHPGVGIAFSIVQNNPISLAFPRHEDGTLSTLANKFIKEAKQDETLKDLTQILTSYSDKFSVADSKRLSDLAETRLPTYKKSFESAGEKYNIDWHLLAAMAYQESHWDHKAISPTGVRGLMMLTLTTAKEMEISNRLDPFQSIEGGSKYLAKLRSIMDPDIKEPDRTLMALAAYNVGRGHLEDARILASRDGKDDRKWTTIREYLPLLSRKKFYSTVTHGYARGNEPVRYVDNILYYQQFLKLQTMTSTGNDNFSNQDSNSNKKWQDNIPPTI